MWPSARKGWFCAPVPFPLHFWHSKSIFVAIWIYRSWIFCQYLQSMLPNLFFQFCINYQSSIDYWQNWCTKSDHIHMLWFQSKNRVKCLTILVMTPITALSWLTARQQVGASGLVGSAVSQKLTTGTQGNNNGSSLSYISSMFISSLFQTEYTGLEFSNIRNQLLFPNPELFRLFQFCP